MTQAPGRQDPEPILLTSLGTGRYACANYVLHVAAERTHRTRFSPVATAALTDIRAGRALVLVTSRVQGTEAHRSLEEELEALGLETMALVMDADAGGRELTRVLGELAERIPRRAAVTLDITYGLRHLPFFYHSALAYLTALRQCRLHGLYYGAWETKLAGDRVPLLDLSSSWQLVEWYAALQTFRKTGHLRPFARSVRGDVSRLFQGAQRDEEVGRLLGRARKAAEELARVLDLGLPLESADRAAALMQRLDGLPSGPGSSGHPAHLALLELRKATSPLAKKWRPAGKKDLVLDVGELRQELEFARWLFEKNRYRDCLGLLREWIVNLFLFARGQTESWLDYGARRQPAERLLAAIRERSRLPGASQAEKTLSSIWQQVAELRNCIAHCGMSADDLGRKTGGLEQQLNAFLEKCRALCEDPAQISQAGRPGPMGMLLVTPLGLSPGVLYTALLRVRPARVLLITSARAREGLPEVLKRAGMPGLEQRCLELSDPQGGFREFGRWSEDPELRAWLLEASSVRVNHTGGTTALQFCASRIGGLARRLGVPAEDVAVLDRRPAAEQRDNPFVCGELETLGEPPADS